MAINRSEEQDITGELAIQAYMTPGNPDARTWEQAVGDSLMVDQIVHRGEDYSVTVMPAMVDTHNIGHANMLFEAEKQNIRNPLVCRNIQLGQMTVDIAFGEPMQMVPLVITGENDAVDDFDPTKAPAYVTAGGKVVLRLKWQEGEPTVPEHESKVTREREMHPALQPLYESDLPLQATQTGDNEYTISTSPRMPVVLLPGIDPMYVPRPITPAIHTGIRNTVAMIDHYSEELS